MFSESQEMYLKTILQLHLDNHKTRSVDVSKALGFSKASVSRAVSKLRDENLVIVGDKGNLILTDKGEESARAVFDRYNMLVDFFIMIGISKEIAEEDACKIEHCLSDETFEKLKAHVCHLKK